MRALPSLLLLSLLGASASAGEAVEPAGWERLEPGLDLAAFPSPRPSEVGDSLVRVLRIDPVRWDLRLLSSSSAEHGHLLTAREWSRRNGLVAAINASMYQTDYKTSVSLMQTPGHVNNSRLSKDNTVLAFDPKDDAVPPVQIIDRKCQDFDSLRAKYGTLVQSIRMISCEGTNVWQQQDRKWSTAAIGMDGSGRILFIHVRSPFSTHDLIDNLLELPLDLKRAMYVEGGVEAQLYVKAGDREHEFVGRYQSPLLKDAEPVALPVPNVVGVVRRETDPR